jgi:hypothetical protein
MSAIQQGFEKVVPRTTTPLGKFIRTGEGILVFGFNIAMVVVPIVSNSLSPAQAVKWAGIVNGIAVVARTGLKIVSVTQGVTGLAPVQLPPRATSDADALAAAVAAALPEDLARTPSLDQLGAQVEQVRGLVSQLVTDAGVGAPLA